jgi:hypothetical protein
MTKFYIRQLDLHLDGVDAETARGAVEALPGAVPKAWGTSPPVSEKALRFDVAPSSTALSERLAQHLVARIGPHRTGGK